MRKKSRTFRFLLSFVLVISTVTTGMIPMTVAAASFTDVSDGAYYSESVAWAVENNITKGTSDTTFSPDDGCTRAQCVTFLYRYAGSPNVDLNNISKFTDVKSGDYFADAFAWAVENEITTGTSDTTFSPGDKCTRAQIVTFLWRYNSTPSVEDTGSFEDVKNDAYYAGAVSWAVENEITKGTSDSTFSPDNTCTRAQIVTFLYRMDLLSGQSIESDLEGYDSSHCKLLDIIPTEESEDVQTEAEAQSVLEDLGLGICPVTYQYNMDGDYVGKTEVEENSAEQHPMYQTLYLSKNEELWNVYMINGNVVAYPVSFNLESDLGSELIVSASETVTCYSEETNEFYETIPYSSESIVEVVEKIDAETLDQLTIEELCRRSGATLPVSTEDETDLMETSADLPEWEDEAPAATVMEDRKESGEDPFIVVSLGDSYSSGEGIPEFYGQNLTLTDKVKNQDWLAHRSMYSWASQLHFQDVGKIGQYRVDYANGETSDAAVQWYFAASSGATTDHINLANQQKGEGKQNKPYYKYTELNGITQALLDFTQIPHIEKKENYLPNQLDVFDTINKNNGNGTIDYVTLTIGGNDLGFVDIITTAAIESSYCNRSGACTIWAGYKTYGTILENELNQRIEDLDKYLEKIKQAYSDIRDKAGEQAVILVAGYPQLLEENGKGTAISKEEATLINSAVKIFNTRLEEMIKEQCGDIGNIYFVDVMGAFNDGSGHQAYSKEAWINPIIPGTKSEDLKDFPQSVVSSYSIHPNSDGAQAYADCVNAEIERIEKKVSETHVQDGTIIDSWEEIIASCNDGTYKSKYHIGDSKALDLGSEGVVDMQIAAFDADELANGSGTAAITWISKQLLNTEHRMNPFTDFNDSTHTATLGTGGIGGWKESEMRSWLNSSVKPLIPFTVRSSIKQVKKYSTSMDTSYNKIENELTYDDVWIPSEREVYGRTAESGPTYDGLFTSYYDRTKKHIDEANNSWWWLRSVAGNLGFCGVAANSVDYVSTGAHYVHSVALGFCL